MTYAEDLENLIRENDKLRYDIYDLQQRLEIANEEIHILRAQRRYMDRIERLLYLVQEK